MENFKDFLLEIENLKIMLQELEREKKALEKELGRPTDIKAYDTAKEPGAPRPSRTVDRVLVDYMDVCYRIHYLQESLSKKLDAKKKIKDNLRKLQGLDYRVVYLRDIENKKLWEIALELNYSEDWIKRVSSRNPRR